MLGEKENILCPSLHFALGRLGVQLKTYSAVWTAELIPLDDEFQIPG